MENVLTPLPPLTRARESRARVWTGRVLTGLIVTFLPFDAIGKQLVGAVLLAAYLGGATATHVRTGTPFWFAITMGVILWIAYGLRSPRLRSFFLSMGN